MDRHGLGKSKDRFHSEPEQIGFPFPEISRPSWRIYNIGCQTIRRKNLGWLYHHNNNNLYWFYDLGHLLVGMVVTHVASWSHQANNSTKARNFVMHILLGYFRWWTNWVPGLLRHPMHKKGFYAFLQPLLNVSQTNNNLTRQILLLSFWLLLRLLR